VRITPNAQAVPNPRTPGGRLDVVRLFDRLRRLHSPAVVCRGCCSLGCSGDCEYGDQYDGELMAVCSHCCIDAFEGRRSWLCVDDHDHGTESRPSAICATAAILDNDYDADSSA
jgi:hypothetical protein